MLENEIRTEDKTFYFPLYFFRKKALLILLLTHALIKCFYNYNHLKIMSLLKQEEKLFFTAGLCFFIIQELSAISLISSSPNHYLKLHFVYTLVVLINAIHTSYQNFKEIRWCTQNHYSLMKQAGHDSLLVNLFCFYNLLSLLLFLIMVILAFILIKRDKEKEEFFCNKLFTYGVIIEEMEF